MRQFLSFVSLLLPFLQFSQRDNVTAGGDISGAGGSVSYSIGQVFYQSQNGVGGNLNQGVQQPYEFNVTLGSENTGLSLSCHVFPNPAQSFLILNSSFFSGSSNIASLYDASGKLLSSTQILSNQTEIGLSHLSNGVYFLSVYSSNEMIKQFKIIKHQ